MNYTSIIKIGDTEAFVNGEYQKKENTFTADAIYFFKKDGTLTEDLLWIINAGDSLYPSKNCIISQIEDMVLLKIKDLHSEKED